MKAIMHILLATSLILSFVRCSKEKPPSLPYFNIRSVYAGGILCEADFLIYGERGKVECGFKWKTDPEAEYENSILSYANSYNYFNAMIYGLSPGTQYYFIAYVRDETGICYSEEKQVTTSKTGTFTDGRDEKTYKWVEIGDQVWMAENLSYLPYISSYTSDTGIFVYNYKGTDVAVAKNQAEYKTYGCLYTWETSLNVCPEGWHLPSAEEWITLVQYLGIGLNMVPKYSWPGTYGSSLLKRPGSAYWAPSTIPPNNITLFSALPAGYHNKRTEGTRIFHFFGLGNTAYFNSSTKYDYPQLIELEDGNPGIWLIGASESTGCSVRCIKD